MLEFQDKVAIITGSTSGIGEATAQMFAEKGATVAVSGRNEERGATVLASLRQGNHVFIPCDTSSESDIKNLIDSVYNKFGRIDIVMNNSANFFTCPLEDITNEKWDYMFDVNVKGYFLVCKYAIPYMRSGSTIINNASVAGMHSYVSGKSFAYSASKSAVIQLSRVLALNYAKDNIRVNAICPGIVQTPGYGKDVSDAAYKIPMNRVGIAKEVASVVTFLASEDASYITGAVIPIDGGLIL